MQIIGGDERRQEYKDLPTIIMTGEGGGGGGGYCYRSSPSESLACVFEAVPHLPLFFTVQDHLAIASTCRSLNEVWTTHGCLKSLAIFLERGSISSSSLPPSLSSTIPLHNLTNGATVDENICPNHSPNKPPRMSINDPFIRIHGGDPGSHLAGEKGASANREWSSLSRFLNRWKQIDTLRFTGSMNGPLEVLVKEALVEAPKAFPTMLPRLTRLILSRVGLFPFNASCIAAALQGPMCANLEELDLSLNGLKDDGAAAIFRAIAAGGEPVQGRRRRRTSSPSHRLSRLKKLDISNNQIGCYGLKALAVALGTGAMPQLQSLALYGNNVREDGGAVLASMVESLILVKLESLDISACGLGWVESRKLLQAASTGGLISLKSLQLGSNYVDSHGIAALAQAMRSAQLPALTHLRLDLSGIDDQAASSLAEALGDKACCPQLRRLDMAKNTSLNGQTWRQIMIGPGLPRDLQELNLANCTRLGSEGTSALVDWASQAGRQTCLIRLLDLTNTGMGPEGGAHLGRGLSQSLFPALETLVLRSNRLGREGVEVLSNELVKAGAACRVQVLDLSENGISDAGMMEFSNALSNGALLYLKELYLAANEMHGSSSWLCLVKVLSARRRGHSSIEVLDVSKNPLGHGAIYECGGSQLFQQLGSLKLAWTMLGSRDAEALVSLLEGSSNDQGRYPHRRPSSLTSLDLAYCELGSSGVLKLLMMAFSGQLPRLKTLSLVGTGLSEANAREVGALMATAPLSGWANLEMIDLRGNELTRESRVVLQAGMTRAKNKALADGIWGTQRRILSLARVSS